MKTSKTSSSEQVLASFRIPSKDNWFTIGYGESRVTLRSQQVRALDLAWALTASWSKPTPLRAIVIGGGAAGVTVAAGLAHKGAQVELLERQRYLLPLQRNCTKRHLHPHVFDWPDDTAANTRADLPLLDWRAGWARDVALEIEGGFRELVEQSDERLQVNTEVSNIELDSPLSGHVSWLASKRSWKDLGLRHDAFGVVRRSGAFDVIIFALGFGLEESWTAGGRASYWADDSLEQHGILPRGKYLVTGSGDGALVDVFRLLLPELRQPDLARIIREATKDQRGDAVSEWIGKTERCLQQLVTRKSSRAAEPGAYLFAKYSRAFTDGDKTLQEYLDVDGLVETLKREVNPHISVTLLTRDASPFSLKARPLHRMILACLYFRLGHSLEVRCNVTVEESHFKPESGHVYYRPNGTKPGERFEHVVFRHGQRKEAFEAFPSVAGLLVGVANGGSQLLEPRFPSSYFGSTTNASGGSGGPDIKDYRDELLGRGYMTESVDGRVPLRRFADIPVELVRSSASNATELDEEEPVALDEDEPEALDEEEWPSRQSVERGRKRRSDDPRAIYERRRRLPVAGFALTPSDVKLDFAVPVFIRGDAGTGKSTLVQQLVQQAIVNQTPDRQVIPLLVRQSSLGLLDAFTDAKTALVEAALRSAELSNYSEAATTLRRALSRTANAPQDRPTVRIFLDGVETCPTAAFKRTVAWAAGNGHEVVVVGRSFPEAPVGLGLTGGFQSYDLQGVAFPERPRLIKAHLKQGEHLAPLASYPKEPFLVVRQLKFEKEFGRPPGSLLEVYEKSIQASPKVRRFAYSQLTQKSYQIAFDRDDVDSETLQFLEQHGLVTGSHRLEFAHLSLGEFLAASHLEEPPLSLHRESLRKNGNDWRHQLDILAMAHAMSASRMASCLLELQGEKHDDLELRQHCLLFRALRLGGSAVRQFLATSGPGVFSLLDKVCKGDSGRFGAPELELLDHVLVWSSSHVTETPARISHEPMLFTGEPAAFRWTLEKLAGRASDGRPPSSHWWVAIYAEARLMVRQSVPLKTVLDQCKGAADIVERELAVDILGDDVLGILAEPTVFTRLHRLGAKPVAQAFNMLAAAYSVHRCDVLERLSELALPAAIQSAIVSNDGDRSVRALAESLGAVEEEVWSSFVSLLTRIDSRKKSTGEERDAIVRLMRRFKGDARTEAILGEFISKGNAGVFHGEKEWKLIRAFPSCVAALRLRLESPNWGEVAIVQHVPEVADLVRNAVIRMCQASQDEDSLERLRIFIGLVSTPDEELQSALRTCLERYRQDVRPVARQIIRAAVKALASSSTARSFVDGCLRPEEDPADAAFILKERGLGDQSLAMEWAELWVHRVSREEPRTTRRDWNSSVLYAAADVIAQFGDQSLWRRAFDELRIGANFTSDLRCEMRRRILERMTLKNAQLLEIVQSEFSAQRLSVETGVRLCAYKKLLESEELNVDELDQLEKFALQERDGRSCRLLWTRFKDRPAIREHLKRIARVDLDALRSAYFNIASESPEGLAALRTLATELAEGMDPGNDQVLLDLVGPLTRDGSCAGLMIRLLKFGGRLASAVLVHWGSRSDIREAARDLFLDQNWRLRFWGRSGVLRRYFEMDRVAQQRLMEFAFKGNPLESTVDVVEALATYEPAREAIIDLALDGEPHDRNVQQAARRACLRAGSMDSKQRIQDKLLRELQDEVEGLSNRRDVDLCAELCGDFEFADDLLLKLAEHSKERVRLASLKAHLRRKEFPPSLGTKDCLTARVSFEDGEEHLDVRRYLVENWRRIPATQEAREVWLREVAVIDFDPEIRRLAASNLRRAERQRALRDDAPEIDFNCWQGQDEICESDDKERFEACWRWLERKLVSSLRRSVSLEEAQPLVDNAGELFGERLDQVGEQGFTVLRLAKDPSELPRDRRIWPATNLVLAWNVAQRLRATEPRQLVLACADTHSLDLLPVLPPLEPGKVVVGPVFFGFSLLLEESR